MHQEDEMIKTIANKKGSVMKKNRGFDYFDAYAKLVGYAHELACNLEDSLESGDFGSRDLVESLHTVENDADEVCHRIHAQLLVDFVVPYERGSMMAFANVVDDICDAIEDIAIQAYYYHCAGVEPAGREMASLVARSTGALRDAVDLLDSKLNRLEDIKHLLVRAQDVESECDRIYIEAVRELYGRADGDGERRRIDHAMLSAIEKASDAVEDAADRLEMMLVENA